ncbi:MAG: 3'-5' exonuclease, partial [Bacilli bacterium]|nr:3'-5' exonuclease [Bacilli bacterium]MDY5898579.1 3'-5' exonuclease [Bacilli bacterium]
FLVESKAKELNISKNKTTILTHIILAHNGQYEYGSPVLPQTPEALVLHMLDDLDSKMNILDNALSDVKVGEFSQKIPYLDMKAYLKIK